MSIPKIHGGKPMKNVPQWAVLERSLLDLQNKSIDLLLERYVTPEGEILWPETVPDFQGYADGNVDNAFEGFYSWPLNYLLGGDERLLTLAEKEYEALLRQFARYKKTMLGVDAEQAAKEGRDRMIVDEWLPDEDWMHQGENAMFFYFLNLANPKNPKNRARALRYADMIMSERNFDKEHNVFRMPRFGTNGPAYKFYEGPTKYLTWMDPYGLAFLDVPGVTTFHDLRDPEKAARYGEVYNRRLGRSDTAVNLFATSMVTTAYLNSGDEKYRDWAVRYIEGWRERYAGNGGIMPDNCGPNGVVGETMDGKWYGGHYGWMFPHGFWFIGDAMVVAGENERLLVGGRGRLAWLREQVDMLISHAVTDPDGTLALPWKFADDDSVIEFLGKETERMLRPDRVTEYPGCTRRRQKDGGWFEFAPMRASQLAHAWQDGFAEETMRTAERVKTPESWSLSAKNVMNKYKGGQDGAFLRYQRGEYPTYPEEALRFSMDQTYGELAELREELSGKQAGFGYPPDGEREWAELRQVTKELNERYGLNWSESITHSYFQTFLLYRNTVSNEALVHLTMGGPMPIYNGGLLAVAVRYFDADRNRPGLPKDVSALVSDQGEDGFTLTLCNLHPTEPRRLIAQAGAYGEHRFTAVTADGTDARVDGKWLEIELAPASVLTARIGLERCVLTPSLEEPIERS